MRFFGFRFVSFFDSFALAPNLFSQISRQLFRDHAISHRENQKFSENSMSEFRFILQETVDRLDLCRFIQRFAKVAHVTSKADRIHVANDLQSYANLLTTKPNSYNCSLWQFVNECVRAFICTHYLHFKVSSNNFNLLCTIRILYHFIFYPEVNVSFYIVLLLLFSNVFFFSMFVGVFSLLSNLPFNRKVGIFALFSNYLLFLCALFLL